MSALFAIPGMYENFEINKKFLKIFKEHKEYFYENVDMRAVYGNFQFCIWDGGRIFTKYSHATKEEIENIIKTYNEELNIPIRLVFTNTIIQEEHCYDRFCNLITNMCHNGQNEIVVNSPILERYLRDNFPNFKYISSTTKCILNTDLLKEELNKEYDLVCLDYNLNHKTNFLSQLTKDEKDKTEFLINAICPPNCANRKEHYKLNSLYHLNYGKPYNMIHCGIETGNLNPDSNSTKTHLTINDILTIYEPMGFSNFKIEGRTFDPLLHICNCVNYLVKPEYRLFLISELAH